LSDPTLVALLTSAAVTGLLHTLIPDHWLPFVLIGSVRRWGAATVALTAGLSALVHSVVSVALGMSAVWIGESAVAGVGQKFEHAGGLVLLLFGLCYAAWAWNKRGHFHPGGSLVHAANGVACNGAEGPRHPEHLHYHADDALITARGGWSAVGLALIVGLNPCVLLLPILFAGSSQGAGSVALVATAYAAPTILLASGLSVLGVRLGWPVRLPGAARYAEFGSGIVIALLGLLLWLFGH